MISSTPRHCWKSAGWTTQSSVTRPPACRRRRRGICAWSRSWQRMLTPWRAQRQGRCSHDHRARGTAGKAQAQRARGGADHARHGGGDGARPAPESTYKFPGATCISVSPAIAHGVPGEQVLRAGDLVNIDVSADIDGFYADTGGSFAIPPVAEKIGRLCRDGKRAMWSGIRVVKPGAKLNAIGRAIQNFADRNRYTLIRNLASHGVGGALHEEPGHIPTWYEPHDTRRISEGLVFTIEPFLSTGS